MKSLSKDIYFAVCRKNVKGHDAFLYIQDTYGHIFYEDCFSFYKELLKKPIESGDLLENSAKLVDNLKFFINAVGTADVFAGIIFLDLLKLKNFPREFFCENRPFDVYEIKKNP